MNVELQEHSCSKCKISFWITVKHDKELQRCHNSFYCPNGHSQFYPGKTDAEKALEERDRYKRWYQSEKNCSGRLVRSNAALRGVVTRMKNKAEDDPNG